MSAFPCVTLSFIVTLSLALLILYVFMKFFSLHKIRLPYAHWSARFSSRWITQQRSSLNENRAIYAAHKRLGSIVRLSPDEVSVSSLEGVRAVYGGDMPKTSWFDAFKNYGGTDNLVTMYDKRRHATRRKMLAGVYSKSFLLTSKDFAKCSHEMLYGRLLPTLTRECAEEWGVVDVYELMSAVFAEWVSAYELGSANGLDIVRPFKDVVRKEYCENGKKQIFQLAGWEEAAVLLEAHCMEMCYAARREVEHSQHDDTVSQTGSGEDMSRPVVLEQLLHGIRRGEAPKDEAELMKSIASESIDHFEAARVGPGITAAYALYELSKHPELQIEVRRELQKAQLDFHQANSVSFEPNALHGLDNIPLLEAIVLETLRRYSSAPGPQRREVPVGGVTIEGCFVPAGTTIHASPYTVHRNEAIFPDPESWHPKRWLESGKAGPLTARRHLLHFSRGSRMCLGNNFTMIAMKLLLAAVYSNFETTVNSHEGVEQMDAALAPPVEDKLMLEFELLKPA